jgi:hypothetical protein
MLATIDQIASARKLMGKALAEHAVFAGAGEEREEEEAKRAEWCTMPIQITKTLLRSVISPAAAS